MLKFLLLFIVSLPAISNSDLRSCFELTDRGCDFYEQCLERKFNCGEKGYAISFGKRYCESLMAINSPHSPTEGKLSPQGLRWRETTRKCLQTQLLPLVDANWEMSCSGIRRFAYETHPTCYTIPGNSFCDLPSSDWWVLLKSFKNPDFSPESFEQLSRIIKSCVMQKISK